MKLLSWFLREDEGVGGEGSRVGNLWGTETHIVFSALLCLSCPSLEPQHSSPEGRTGCRCSQTLSLLRKGGASGPTLEAWSEGLAPARPWAGRLGHQVGGEGGREGLSEAREAKGRKEEAAALPKRLREGGGLVPGWERRSGARPLGAA